MPRSINRPIQEILDESKELIERSRQLRARSLQATMMTTAIITRRSGSLSYDTKERWGGLPDEAKNIVR